MPGPVSTWLRLTLALTGCWVAEVLSCHWGGASLLLGAGPLSAPGLEAQVQGMGERAPLSLWQEMLCSALLMGWGVWWEG